MTRHSLSVFIHAVYHTLSAEAVVHEVAYEHGIIRDHGLSSLRSLEKLPKLSLCIILSDLVEAGITSQNLFVAYRATDMKEALFIVDGRETFDALLNHSSTPLPFMALCKEYVQGRESGTMEWNL